MLVIFTCGMVYIYFILEECENKMKSLYLCMNKPKLRPHEEDCNDKEYLLISNKEGKQIVNQFQREGNWKGKENLSTHARGKGDWKGQRKMSTHCKGEGGWKCNA